MTERGGGQSGREGGTTRHAEALGEGGVIPIQHQDASWAHSQALSHIFQSSHAIAKVANCCIRNESMACIVIFNDTLIR